MKTWLLLLAGMMMLSACSFPPATICVMPTDTTQADNDNPLDIKQDTIDYVGKRVTKEFKKQLEDNWLLRRTHTMHVVDDCSQAEYSLLSRIKTINNGSSSESTTGFSLGIASTSGTSSRSFVLGLDGTIKDNKTNTTVATFKTHPHEGPLGNVIETDVWYCFRYGMEYP